MEEIEQRVNTFTVESAPVKGVEMNCASCLAEKPLDWKCEDCGIGVWCSPLCSVKQQATHIDCEASAEQIGGREIGVRAGTRLRSLRGRTDFKRTIPLLFDALLVLPDAYKAAETERKKADPDLELLCTTSKADTQALCNVNKRMKEVFSMLDSIKSEIAKTLSASKESLKETIKYDVKTAVLFAIENEPLPSLVGSIPPDKTFRNSFDAMENFVEAGQNTKNLSVSTPAPLHERYLTILSLGSAPGKVGSVRKFKADLERWAAALDKSFEKMIKPQK